ncbi:MAG TPA: glycoside hydrolase family 5 protein [Bacillota bacterium]|nr:glycoside hydrolase family 5 protein [Bacillota bacterium]
MTYHKRMKFLIPLCVIILLMISFFPVLGEDASPSLEGNTIEESSAFEEVYSDEEVFSEESPLEEVPPEEEVDLSEYVYPPGDGLLDPYAQAAALGKGINFGNLMEAKPNEGAWSNGIVITEAQFDLAKSAGFDSVRIPIRFSGHAKSKAPYTIDKTFMKRVDKVVGWGLSKGLRVVVDLHHYDELHQKPSAHEERYIELWKQIAAYFRSYPDEVYYELLNEPSQNLDVYTWNGIFTECLREIRKIDNHHTVIIGSVNYCDIAGLKNLRIPVEETNAIVTFHYYNPSLFCFQGLDAVMGSDWANTGIKWPGPPATKLIPKGNLSAWASNWFINYNTITNPDMNPAGPGIIVREIQQAADWGAQNKRPLWMSEFTAQDGADMTSRISWISFVRKELEKHKIPWSFWTLVSDMHSHIYDLKSGKWSKPLTDALGLEI